MDSENPIDQNSTGPNANQNSADKKDEVDPGPTPVGTTKTNLPPSHADYKITCNKKRDGWDYAKFFAELVGLGFLIAYTIFTAKISCSNRRAANAAHDTLIQIQQQTTWMGQELEGTMAAFIDTKVEFSNFNQPEEYLTVTLPNTGHLIASRITGDLKVTIRNLPDEQIVKVLPDFIFSEPELNVTQETSAGAASHKYILQLSQKEWELIRATKETIRVDGPMNYFNGFRDVPRPICSSILYYEIRDNTGALRSSSGPNFVHCDEFPTQVDAALKWKKEHEGKEWK